MTADEVLAWPLWDLDAVDCERHHLDERRDAVRLYLESPLDALRHSGWAPEIRREAVKAVRDCHDVMDHLRVLRRELNGRAALH